MERPSKTSRCRSQPGPSQPRSSQGTGEPRRSPPSRSAPPRPAERTLAPSSKEPSKEHRPGSIGQKQRLHVPLRTAKCRSISSQRWLQRQLNDVYVQEAQKRNLRSRAWFKLQHIDAQFQLIRPDTLVLDLGAAPGSWLQYATARTQVPVIAVDILPIEPMDGVHIITGDLAVASTTQALATALNGRRPSLVLSDMAAPTTGHRSTDRLRTNTLAEEALRIAMATLKPGGNAVIKVFEGGIDSAVMQRLRPAFKTLRTVKPPASRKNSPELYLVALQRIRQEPLETQEQTLAGLPGDADVF